MDKLLRISCWRSFNLVSVFRPASLIWVCWSFKYAEPFHLGHVLEALIPDVRKADIQIPQVGQVFEMF